VDTAIDSGCYAREQIHSRDRLIAWSHRRRFTTALMLGRQFAGQRLLDYGCGDGTFLGLLMSGTARPSAAVGAEIHQDMIDDLRSRFADYPGLNFARTDELSRAEEVHRYDGIFCMEVLEHVVDWHPLLGEFERLLKPGGHLVVSTPIEIGLPLLVKQAVRRVAGWRGIGHYPGTTSYTTVELVKSVFAKSTQHIVRPVFEDGEIPFHDHKGFNWRVLRTTLTARFDIVGTLTSPMNWLGPQFATQIWFIAQKRGAR
jgi:2-polyprenyl-3-methyl-5-hydroxy-6-metoxy-1,4-benzoquinol methylase